MKNKALLGGILATIGALMGIIGHFVIFLQWYQIGMHTQSAEPGCEILLKYVHPAMADLGIFAGVLFAVSAYGFFTKQNWAFPLSVIGIVLALLGSWFINVPYMAADLPPIYFPLFWPYLILYFLLMRGVGDISWSRTLFALLTGIAYIFCFMNGIASSSRIITIGAPIFTLVQRLHWVATIGWAIVTAGLLIRPAGWMRVLGLVSGTTELVVGVPLAYVTAQQLGRFSLFALGPIACLVLVILLVLPGLWEKWTVQQDRVNNSLPAARLGPVAGKP
jgi:hypothetical protein